MKKIRIRHLILIALIFVQCSVDQDESNLDLIQGENVQNEDNKASDSTKKYVEGEPKPLADAKGKLQSKANKVALQAGADFIQ